MKYPERDPFEVYAEARDAETVRDIVNDKVRNYVLQQVHIGYPELKQLLLREFRSGWEQEWESPDGSQGGSRLVTAQLPLREAEQILTAAIASTFAEIQEVRALALDEGSSLKESPDVAEGSSPRAAPSAFMRFWNRMRRSPWS